MNIRGKFYAGDVGHSVVFAVDGRENVRYSKFGGDAAYTSNIYDPVFIPKHAFGGFNFDNPPKTNEDIPLAATAADTLSFFQDRILLTVGLRQQAITTKAARNPGRAAATGTGSVHRVELELCRGRQGRQGP